MKTTRIFLPFLLTLLFTVWTAAEVKAVPTGSATAVASEVAAKLRNTPGLKAEFRIDADGHKVTGSLLASGNKFRIMSGAWSSWYDGSSLYTLNPRTKETTVVRPTPSELVEANPLLFVNGASDRYTVAFSSHQPEGKYMIVLTPTRKGESIKSVFITVDRRSLRPESIVVTGSDGSVSTLTVTSLQLNMKIGGGIFIYPKSKYPGFKIVDLR